MTSKNDHTKKASKIYEGRKHKTHRSKTKSSKKPRRRTWSITALIVIIAIIAVLALTPSVQDIFTGKVNAENETVLVTVNGDTITEQEFNKQWNTLPPNVKLQVGKDALLDDMVNQELLLQEAEKKGISTSQQEAEGFVKQQLGQSGQTLDQFKQQIKTQDLSYENVLSTYQRQLTIAKLFDQYNSSSLNVSEEEIEEYYENNKDQFIRENQVTVRHILIEVNNQTSDAEALNLAENISERLEEKNNSNFCSLVQNHSMDLGSKENCGEYTFGRGRMAKPFENASFEMDIGERELVNTTFGYHIILKMNESEARQLNLNDTMQTEQGQEMPVRTVIEQQLSQQMATSVYEDHVEGLRENATITYEDKGEAIEEDNNNSLEATTDNQTVVLDENVNAVTE